MIRSRISSKTDTFYAVSVIKFLRDLISASKKGNSTTHVLLRLIGNWKTTLDSNLFTEAVLIYLPSIWLYSTGAANSQIACPLFRFHVSNTHFSKKLLKICRDLFKILSGLPQGCILSLILFIITIILL